MINAQRIVVKIGSSIITRNGQGLSYSQISAWAKQIHELRQQGKEIILVSSGSVAEGMVRLGWAQRPNAIYELQTAAAVGQSGLIESYQSAFKQYDINTAQILLTHDDLANRKRYLNARSTLRSILSLGVIPIINENDTVAVEEIRLGDNDSLAAMVANLIEADLLVILTDQHGLFDKNPQEHADATLIKSADANDVNLLDMAQPTTNALGRGGMTTKVLAARQAARSGANTIIASGKEENILTSLLLNQEPKPSFTLLTAANNGLNARKQWLSGNLVPKGTITLDDGAINALQKKGSSLLAIGVTSVTGKFERGDLVSCCDQHNREIARGLINYDYLETDKIRGVSSEKITDILGYQDEPELINRDNLVLVS